MRTLELAADQLASDLSLVVADPAGKSFPDPGAKLIGPVGQVGGQGDFALGFNPAG